MTRLWSLLRGVFLGRRPKTIATFAKCDACGAEELCAPLSLFPRVDVDAHVCGNCLQSALHMVERAEARAERSSNG